jgi:hypothetical protein
MTPALYVVFGLVGAGVLGLLLAKPVRAYFSMRGDRVVTCPDNGEIVAVNVDALRAAAGTAAGRAGLRLEACSRWPEKAGCGQDCLAQIEATPTDCLVRVQVGRWYTDKTCGICGTALGMVDWTARKPALRAPDGKTVEWQDVRPETLYDVMATHTAICWDCHVAETFRRERPDLTLDNPFAPPPQGRA